MARIKALAFDAYGTLFDVFSVTARCERLFPGRGQALAELWRTKQLHYTLLRSLMGRYRSFWPLTADALTYAAKALRLDLDPSDRDALMHEYLRLQPFDDASPGLEALRARGLPLAILSNGEPRMLEAAAANAGLDHLFDAIVSADEVGIYKVSPQVYARGAERLGVAIGELGFVSANAWDVSGAASAGLATFWIRRHADTPPEEMEFGPTASSAA